METGASTTSDPGKAAQFCRLQRISRASSAAPRLRRTSRENIVRETSAIASRTSARARASLATVRKSILPQVSANWPNGWPSRRQATQWMRPRGSWNVGVWWHDADAAQRQIDAAGFGHGWLWIHRQQYRGRARLARSAGHRDG